MFPVIVATGAGLIFGGLALYSVLKPTAQKVKKGDSVFVHPSALVPVDPSVFGDLSRFISGYMSTSVKVDNVMPTGPSDPTGPDNAIGSIAGLSPPVKFSLKSVTLIQRNGKQFT